MPGYSVLFPPLAALLGPRLVGALSAVAAALAASSASSATLRRRARGGSLWFAVATVSTLISGRLTFALGVARRPRGACSPPRAGARLGLRAGARWRASPARSPAAFVALAAAAWWLDRPRWWPVALAAARSCPPLALAVAFPEGGSFPFVGSSFWPALAAAIAVGLVVPREARVAAHRRRALRAARSWRASRWRRRWAATSCASARSSRARSSPRSLWRTNRRALAPAGAAARLLAVGRRRSTTGRAPPATRPCTSATTTALLGFLGAQRGGPFRIEIPFTDNHWESRWVAPHVPLARGWERQVDRQRNALFYDDRPLTAARYRRWLDDNAVRFVALADAPIDYSAAREAAARARRARPYLREVWHDAHWRVFAVAGARPLASGAARVDRDRARARRA